MEETTKIASGSPSSEALAPKSYYQHARPEIMALVPRTARRILDVGCGAGALGAQIRARQTAELHGIELNEKVAQESRCHFDYVWQGAVESVLPELENQSYDCIIIADVLEHLVDPLNTLAKLKAKLTNHGKLIASIPNIQNWEVISDLLQGRWEYRNEGILDKTHLRFFTQKSIREMFWSSGFRILKLSNTESAHSLPRRLLTVLRREGLISRSFERDVNTFQFLIEAEAAQSTSDRVIDEPKIAVVVLNWNGGSDTVDCIASLQATVYKNREIIVVDNGSTDNSLAIIRGRFPTITILETGENLGYAGGNNVGIRRALATGAEFILLLNNDTVVDRYLLNAFIEASRIVSSNVILGAKIYCFDEPETLWFAGARWRYDTLTFEHEHLGDNDILAPNRFVITDYITGCALFASSSTFSKVGLLNEKFFLTYEETDWCYRARSSGHECIVVPAARLWHKVSASFGGAESPLQMYFYARNGLLWAEKHLSKRLYFAFLLRTLNDVLRFDLGTPSNGYLYKRIWWGCVGVRRRFAKDNGDVIARAKYLGLRDYFLRRFGDCPTEVRTLRVVR